MTGSPHALPLRRAGLALLAAAVLALVGAGPLSAQTPDTCSNAAVIPASGPFPYTATVATTGFGDDSGDPTFVCNTSGLTPNKTSWFTFTPATTDNYKLDTLTSSPLQGEVYDTILGMYTGTCGNLTPLANGCNNDDSTSGTTLSSVSLALNAGTTYTIIIGGLGSRDPFNPANVIPSKGGTLRFKVSKVPINYPYQYVVPSVAHVQGFTLYTSDLTVTNVDSADGSFTIQFLGHGKFNDLNPPPSQPTLSPFSISAGGTLEIVDILGAASTFNLSNDYGALLIQSTRKLLIGARTSTGAGGGGTFGQFAAAVDLSSSDILLYQETARFIGVHEDSSSFRTNIVLFNTTIHQCGVEVKVIDTLGQQFASGGKLPVLPPNTMVQISGLKDYFGFDQDVQQASITVRNVAPDCKVGGIAYVIDRTTNDPYAVPLKK